MAAAMPWRQDLYEWAAAASCIALVLLWIAAPRKGRQLWPFYAMLSVLGFFCYCSASCCRGQAPEPEFAARAMHKLCAAIDSCGLRGEESAALIKALLTGERSGLSRGSTAAFRASGASHILALSGLHLGVIYAILRKVLGILGNSRPAELARSMASVGLCSFYALMTGAGASITRALLFIILNEAGRLLPGRRHSRLSVFCTAITLQLAFSPLSIDTLSFQLSYLAMLGLVCIEPLLAAFYPLQRGHAGPMARIWQSAAASISCQLTTAPLVYLKFKSLPRHFLLTNLLALPLTECLIISSLVMLALAGNCPEQLKGLCDFLAQALIWCLKIIAEM